MKHLYCLQIEGKEKLFVFNSLFNRKPGKGVKDRRCVARLRHFNRRALKRCFLCFEVCDELLRTASE